MDENGINEAYEELDAIIRKIVDLENPHASEDDSDKDVVAEWVVSVGVLTFGSDGYQGDDTMVIAKDEFPVWRVKGLLDSTLTKLRAVEGHNLMVALHATDGDEEE